MRHAQQFMYLYCIYGNWKTKYFTLPEGHCFDPKDVQLVLYYYYCCCIIIVSTMCVSNRLGIFVLTVGEKAQ